MFWKKICKVVEKEKVNDKREGENVDVLPSGFFKAEKGSDLSKKKRPKGKTSTFP